MILNYNAYDFSTKAVVVDKLLRRLLNGSEIGTESGYFDSYDELCTNEEANGGVWFATIDVPHESSDVYYFFHETKTISCVRCLTGYKREEDVFDEVRVDTKALMDAFKAFKNKK